MCAWHKVDLLQRWNFRLGISNCRLGGIIGKRAEACLSCGRGLKSPVDFAHRGLKPTEAGACELLKVC